MFEIKPFRLFRAVGLLIFEQGKRDPHELAGHGDLDSGDVADIGATLLFEGEEYSGKASESS